MCAGNASSLSGLDGDDPLKECTVVVRLAVN